MGYEPSPALVNVRTYLGGLGEWPMYLDDSCAKLMEFEGCIQWMYLDTRGVVTVGVGRALFRLDDALALPFGVAGRRATMHEVSADYERVKAMRQGMAAAGYRVATSPVLDKASITAMLMAKVEQFDAVLRMKLSGYVKAPDVAKLALLDMAYETGVNGLLKFTHLCAAVSMGEWSRCPALCERTGPAEARNVWTKAMFAAAAALPRLN